jgi:hypothetical protein
MKTDRLAGALSYKSDSASVLRCDALGKCVAPHRSLVIPQRQRQERRVRRDEPPVDVLVGGVAIMLPDGHIVRPTAGYDRLCAIQRPCTSYEPKDRAHRVILVHQPTPDAIRSCKAAVLLLVRHQERVPRGRAVAGHVRILFVHRCVVDHVRPATRGETAVAINKANVDIVVCR